MPGLVYTPLDITKNEIRVLRMIDRRVNDSARDDNDAIPKFSLHVVDLDDFTSGSRTWMKANNTERISPLEYLGSLRSRQWWGTRLKSALHQRIHRQKSENVHSILSQPTIHGRWNWGDFRAISYVWGKSIASREVKINSHMVRVTDNLFDILQCLWLSKGPFVPLTNPAIWVDALCINQLDVEERSLQVRRMGLVYGQSFQTIAWIGNNGPGDVHRGAMFINAFRDQLMDQTHQKKTSQLRHSQSDDAFLTSFRRLQDHDVIGFAALLLSAYWSRLWIVQEIVLGQENVVFAGHRYEVSYNDMDMASAICWRHIEEIEEQCSQSCRFVGIEDLSNDIFHRIYLLRRLLGLSDITKDGFSLFDLLLKMAISADSEQSDDKDKVYGMLSLQAPGLSDMIVPSYTKSVAEVYTDFARAVILFSGSLDLMFSSPLAPQARHSSADSELPTWVPDWRLFAASSRPQFSHARYPYQASGDRLAKDVSFKEGLLGLKGFVFDVCEGLSISINDSLNVIPLKSSRGDPWPEFRAGSCLLNAYKTVTDTREALWRTMILNKGPDYAVASREFEWLLSIHLDGDSITLESSDTDNVRAEYNTQRRLNGQLLIGGIELCKYYSSSSDFETAHATKENWDEWDKLIQHACHIAERHKLIVTATGYLAMGMSLAQQGDKICILLGSSMPVILRPVQGTEHWQMLGSCYVHGIMDGEAIGWLEDGRYKLRDFTIC